MAIAAVGDDADRYRAVIESAVDGIIIIAADGTVQAYNLACERIFGFARAEVIGNNVNMLMPAADRTAHDGHILAYRETGQHSIIGRRREVAGQRKDGSIFPMDLSVSETFVGDDIIIVGIVRDISERKETEADLRQANEALRRANAKLEGFTSAISHDLRAPLRTVDGYLSLLREDHTAALDAAALHLLDTVGNGVAQMHQLIDDLLTYAIVGNKGLTISTVSMTAIVDQVMQQELALADQDGRTFDVDLGDLPDAAGDPPLLRQVWANLIGNAVKYTRHRPVAKIKVGGCATPGGAEYWIQDNGVGFDQTQSEHAFTPFRRLHKMSEFEGSGVGLSLVQQIIDQHGGQVWAQAQPNKGATFFFSLPVQLIDKSSRHDSQPDLQPAPR